MQHPDHTRTADSPPEDTGTLIEESIRRLLQPHCTSARLKDAEGDWSEALWSELDVAGFTRAWMPSGQADLDIPITAALNIIRTAASFAAPVPLAESMLASWLLAKAAIPASAGPLTIAPVNAQPISLTRTATGWQIAGSASRVPFGRSANTVVVAAELDGQGYLAAVPRAGVLEVKKDENLAREPRDTLRIHAELPEGAVAPFAAGVDGLYKLGAAVRVLQMTGALDTVLRLTVQYAQERKQFGRALGKFQAIQQNVAVMAAHIAACRAACNAVVQNLADDGPDHGIAAAKLRTNEAAGIAARTAHQVHGAMGFTQEYELHFYTKRLWSWRDEFGTEAFWGQRLGRAVCAHGADELWSFITAEMS